jgi:hypothetical protein
MKSGFIFFAFAVAALAAAPDKPQVQGQLLDHNEYLCNNCFFGASTYYYCFEADKKILIGYQKIPTLNWKDEASNDLTKVHKSWAPWAAENNMVPLRYDDKFIWVTRNDGKTVKLKQDYTTDIFVNSSQCRSVVKKKTE